MVTQLMYVREVARREREETRMKPCLSHEANLTGSETTEEENEQDLHLKCCSEEKYTLFLLWIYESFMQRKCGRGGGCMGSKNRFVQSRRCPS